MTMPMAATHEVDAAAMTAQINLRRNDLMAGAMATAVQPRFYRSRDCRKRAERDETKGSDFHNCLRI